MILKECLRGLYCTEWVKCWMRWSCRRWNRGRCRWWRRRSGGIQPFIVVVQCIWWRLKHVQNLIGCLNDETVFDSVSIVDLLARYWYDRPLLLTPKNVRLLTLTVYDIVGCGSVVVAVMELLPLSSFCCCYRMWHVCKHAQRYWRL